MKVKPTGETDPTSTPKIVEEGMDNMDFTDANNIEEARISWELVTGKKRNCPTNSNRDPRKHQKNCSEDDPAATTVSNSFELLQNLN